jgi:hypothetical protein
MKTIRKLLFLLVFIIVVVILFWGIKWGIPFLGDKIQIAKDEAANAKLRDEVYALFPSPIAAKLRTLGVSCSSERIINIIKNGIPDDFQRTQIALRIIGLNDNIYLSGGGTFDLYSHICMSDINDSVVLRTIRRFCDDDLEKKGAFRWLFRHNTLANMKPNDRAPLLLKLVPTVLSTEPRWNQRLVIRQLESFGDTASLMLLNQVLEGKIILAYPDEKIDLILNLPDHTAKDRCSARALAALALANLGQKQSLPRITELAITASEDDKAVYDMAIGLLRK